MNYTKELNEYTKQIQKNVLQKYFTKNSRCYDSNPSPVTVPHINSSQAFTMLLSSELGDTLVKQLDFYTSIIVIVAFDAGIEEGSINYLYLISCCTQDYIPLQGDESI